MQNHSGLVAGEPLGWNAATVEDRDVAMGLIAAVFSHTQLSSMSANWRRGVRMTLSHPLRVLANTTKLGL